MQLGTFSISLAVKDLAAFNPGWDSNAQPLPSFTDVRELQRQLKALRVRLQKETGESTTGPASFLLQHRACVAMDTSRFEGKTIHEYGKGSQALYQIRGNLIHEHGRGTQAIYEIRGNLVHEYARNTAAVYEIRGNEIYEYGRGTQAVYEIR